MNRVIIILISLLMVGCIPMAGNRQIVPVDPLANPRFMEKKEAKEVGIKVKIKVKSNEKSLERAVSDLNNIYGDPVVEINAIRSGDDEIIIMKKLYYQIDEKIFIVVSIVNDRVILIDTIHSPNK